MIPLIKKSLSPRWPTWLLVLLTIFIPLQHRFYKIFKPLSRKIAEHQGELPLYFEKNFCFYVTDLIVLFLFVKMLFATPNHWRTFLWAKGGKYLILLLATAFISILFSSHHNYGLQYFRLFQFGISFLLFSALANGTSVKEILPKIFWCITFLALFECVVGISQYFIQGELGLRFLGEIKLNSKVEAPANFLMSDGSRWIFDRLFHLTTGPNIILRAPGTFPHPNVFGGFLVFSSIVSYCLYCWVSTKRERLFLSFAIPLQLFTLCLTFSRAALIGWLLGTTLWLVLFFRTEMADFRPKLKSFIPILFTSGCLCLCLLYPQFLERGGVVNYNHVSRTADKERLIYQDIAFQMVKKNPLIGVGFNNFLIEMEGFTKGEKKPDLFQIPHNIYLLLLSETGILGLGFFLLFIGSVIVGTLRGEKTLFSLTLLTLFLAFLWLGCCDYYPLITQHGKLMFFMVAGFLASYAPKRLSANVQPQPLEGF